MKVPYVIKIPNIFKVVQVSAVGEILRFCSRTPNTALGPVIFRFIGINCLITVACSIRRKKVRPGSLMKAIIRPGEGSARPINGNQVIFHCTVRTLDGVTVESTRVEDGGKGTPMKYVLGKSNMLFGLFEGILTMLKGEVAAFKMKPELHYGEVNCPLVAPEAFPINDQLHFEVEMLDFFKVKAICEDLGVLKKVIREGRGWETPREPYEVQAWITARSNNEEIVLYSSDEPLIFTFGKDEVPKGLEMGIGTMTRGEKAVIFVRNTYFAPSRFIAKMADVDEIQFEVEIIHFIQVRDMLGDGRLIKRRLVDGKGEFPMDCPLQDSLLRVHYKGILLNEEKTVFYDTRVDNGGQPLEFCSGEGLVPEGFEMCVRLMLPGERALVTCPPDYAYDKFPRPPNVPEGAHVQWEIDLISFEMPKDWTGLSFDNIMDEAEKVKSTGNRLFKEGKFELAKAKYEKVLRDYNHVNPPSDEDGKLFLMSRNSLYLNVAACYQQMGEYRKAIETCDKVLDANPAHVKALYRRGMAFVSVGDFEEARNDFKMMMRVDNSSAVDAATGLAKLRLMEQEAHDVARKQFKGLFDKKPGIIGELDKESIMGIEPVQGNSECEMVHAQETVNVGFCRSLWSVIRQFSQMHGVSRCTIL